MPKALLTIFQSSGHFLLYWLLGASTLMGHAPYFIFPIYLAALIIFLFLIQRAVMIGLSTFHICLRGWFFAFGMFATQLFWVGNAFVARGPEFIWVLPAGVIILPGGLALFWALGIWLYTKLRSTRIWGQVFLLTALLMLAEWLRGHLFGGLPWGLPAMIWKAGGAISQSASVIGAYGLSFLTIGLCAAFAFALHYGRRVRGLAIAFASLFILIFLFGFIRLSFSSELTLYSNQEEWIKFRMVSPNISMREKLDPGFEPIAFERFMQLSGAEGLEEVDYVLWSENALPQTPPLAHNREKLREIGQKLKGTDLLTGSIRYSFDTESERYHAYNSLLHVSFAEDGEPIIQDYYDKIRLAPFGEILPFEPLLKFITFGLLNNMASLKAGSETKSFELKHGKKATALICYEDIFPDFLPRGDKRPDLIINISNDSWFGTAFGPHQHLNQARYRAIEEGLAMVRTASGGFSGTINPYGRVSTGIKVGDSGVADLYLGPSLHNTIYSRITKHFTLFICIIITLLGVYTQVVQPKIMHKGLY